VGFRGLRQDFICPGAHGATIELLPGGVAEYQGNHRLWIKNSPEIIFVGSVFWIRFATTYPATGIRFSKGMHQNCTKEGEFLSIRFSLILN
jgi:hypothetical protein